VSQEVADGFDAYTHPDATGKGPDRTHLNHEGQLLFGRIVAADLARQLPELAPNVQLSAPVAKQ